MRIIALINEAIAVGEILAHLGSPHQLCAWRRPVVRRCGRCQMAGRASATRRLFRRRTTLDQRNAWKRDEDPILRVGERAETALALAPATHVRNSVMIRGR